MAETDFINLGLLEDFHDALRQGMKDGSVAVAGAVYDISAAHLDGNSQPTTYANIAAALGNNGANVPAAYRKGGMSVKFVQSSDNKYVSYFLPKDEWSDNPNDWQKIVLEDEIEKILEVLTEIPKASTTVGKWIDNYGSINNNQVYSIDYYDVPAEYTKLKFTSKFTLDSGNVNIVHYFNGSTRTSYEYPVTVGIDNYSGILTVPAGTTQIAINRNSADTTSLVDLTEYDGSLAQAVQENANDINGVKQKLDKEIKDVGFYENTVNAVAGSTYNNYIYGDFKAGDVITIDLIGDITVFSGNIPVKDSSGNNIISMPVGRSIEVTLPRNTQYLYITKNPIAASGAITLRIHYDGLQKLIDEKIDEKSDIYERILSNSDNIVASSSVDNAIIGIDGEPIQINHFSYSVFIISDETKRYFFKTGLTGSSLVVVHYYSNGVHIGGAVLSQSDKTEYSGFLTLPAGTDEIRINRNSADTALLCTTELFDGSLIDVVEELEPLPDILKQKTEIVVSSTVSNKFIKNDGSESSAMGYNIRYYDISDLTKNYYFKLSIEGAGINAVHYFNGNTHLSYEYPVVRGVTEYSGLLHIPIGTTKIALNTQTSCELYYTELYDGSLPDKVLDNTSRIDVLEECGVSDKNYVVLGDSITWLGGVNCDDADGWTKWFKDKMKPKSIKSYAWSGATWTNTVNTVATDTEISSLDDNNTIWQQIRRLIADVNNETQVTPDVVIIAAGVNDVIAGNARPDCLSKTAAQAFSNWTSFITSASVQTIVTLADSVRYGCEMLIQAFPDVQIILCTPLQNSKSGQDEFVVARQIIKECGGYLSANVIEQDKVCGVYRTQEYPGTGTGRNNHNLYDGLHTSEIGAKKIGSIIASIVKAMIV